MKLSVVDQSPIPAGFTSADALQNTIQLARLADRLGYERYWLAEHHSAGSFAGTVPDVLIARVGAETKSIRLGSGAVLLPHYSPLRVAEAFRTLHALYPDRIDLGLGRAPGGTPLESYALQGERESATKPDTFPDKLIELMGFLKGEFPDDHPFNRIQVQPEMPGSPEVWLLGSSGWSADAAAQLGLPYGAAHFINSEPTRRSIEHYRENFQPSPTLSEPKVLVTIGAVCTDTQQEADRHYSSYRYRRIARERGERGPIPTPEDAIALLGDAPDPVVDDNSEWPRVMHGPIGIMHERLSEMADSLKIDELMLITVVHSHEARMHSYELLADAFGITPRSDQEVVTSR